MTERDIQIALYWYRVRISGYPMILPNTYMYNWESDLLYISKERYVTEYEIKLSRADFLADKNKIDKHRILSLGYMGPKFFYYVCPIGLIKESEIPTYSGLAYVSPDKYTYDQNCVKIIKRAPQRKVSKISDQKMEQFYKKGIIRYWDLLTKGQDEINRRKN